MQHIAELKTKRDTAGEHLSQLSRAGKAAWEELKEGFSRAFRGLKSGLAQAASPLKWF